VRAMAEELEVDLGDLCAQIAFNTETVYGSWQDGLVE
jgi:TatD DNase family protein